MSQLTIYTCDKCFKESKDGNFLLTVTLIVNKNWHNGIDHSLCSSCQNDIKTLVREFVKTTKSTD